MVNNYSVAEAYSVPQLITKVNAMIAMGWQPQGSIAYNPNDKTYLQAMWTVMK